MKRCYKPLCHGWLCGSRVSTC